MNWIEAIARLSEQDKSFVIVTILAVQGSAPRDATSKMIVDENHIYDSIGGGNLEYQAIAKARTMLSSSLAHSQPTIIRESFRLGKDLVQCCGGHVELLFEYIAAKDFNVVLFGAGHVGQALATILSALPCKVKWIDSRAEFVREQSERFAANIDLVKMRNPDVDVEECAANAYFLVMTHSHELDMQLVEAILSRNDVRFCGLIGSKSKAAKFRKQLARKQFNNNEIARLTSPIGLEQVGGKRPMEVAVAVAAQLIALQQPALQQAHIQTELD